MNQQQVQLFQNIRKSIDRISRGVKVDSPIPIDELKIIKGGNSGKWGKISLKEGVTILEQGININPTFFKRNDQIKCVQEYFFGVYALRLIFRGLILATNHFVAGKNLEKEMLFGPAISCFYSASFHLLHSYLALNGKVFIEPVKSTRLIEPSFSPDIRKILLGVYQKKGNTWSFQVKSRNHKDKWAELKSLLALPKTRPESFSVLFCYFYGADLSWVRSKEGHAFEFDKYLNDRMDGFIEMIANTRHFSIYQSFGSDPEVVDAIVNGETFNDRVMDSQMAAFSKFSEQLYFECLELVSLLVDGIKIDNAVREAISLLVFHPYFDTPKVSLVKNEELRFRLKWLYELIFT